MQSVRYTLRSFRRTPAFTLTAILTLALGIGASTAIFSVVDRILFRPLPYPAADRLVSFGMYAPSADKDEFLVIGSFLRFRRSQTPFTAMAAFNFVQPCDVTGSNPERVGCARVDAGFLPMLGLQPILGRVFTPQEDRPNAPRVALLSYAWWQRHFAGDRAVVGRSITLDEQPTTIIGVLPREFELPALNDFDLLVPAALVPGGGIDATRVFARLKPGVTIRQAAAAMAPLLEAELPNIPAEFRQGIRLAIRPLRDRQTEDVGQASWILLGAVVMVLLIACGNVANLLLARSAGRRREFAIRCALGARRADLLRQAMTESLLLAGFGAFGGCVLGWELLRFFVDIAPSSIPRIEQASLDGRVLLFAIAAAFVSALLFGTAHAFERPDPAALAGGRSVVSFRGVLRHCLIAGQVAASLVLLTGAGLLLRSLWKIESLPLGIHTDHVVTARFTLSHARVRQQRVLPFYEDLEARLQRIPGSQASAIASTIPMVGGTGATPFYQLEVEGRSRLEPGTGGVVAWRYITPGYFAALGIPILRGRTFDEAERQSANAIVLSNRLARLLFPHEDPLGKRLRRDPKGPWLTVVGIAGDVKERSLQRDTTEYFLVRKHTPDAVFGNGAGSLSATAIVRTPLDPGAAAKLLRAAVAAVDPTLPVTIETLQQRLSGLTARPRFNALLLAGFASVALLLAAVGIYGVTSFLVSQRTREVGVRMALGATPAAVSRLFVLHAARWTLAGAVAGVAGSYFTTRLLAGLLFGVPQHDAATLVAAPALLLTAAMCAAWLPARRAARVDPVETLRQE